MFLLRLASLVMPAGVNLVRYHGIFAPAAKYRALAVPEPPPNAISRPSARWIRWQTLIAHVFGRATTRCPRCGVEMEHLATLQGHGRAFPVLLWIDRYGEQVVDALARPP